MKKYRLSQMKKRFKNKKRYRPLTLDEYQDKQINDYDIYPKYNKPIIALEQHRTFGGDLPRNVRRALTDEQLELVEGKDIQIITTYEIEIY